MSNVVNIGTNVEGKVKQLFEGEHDPVQYALMSCLKDAINSFLEDRDVSLPIIVGALETLKIGIAMEMMIGVDEDE